MNSEKIIAIADKLLEYNYITTKQHRFFATSMTIVNENYEVDRRILKRQFIRYSPAETSIIKTTYS